jgi:hypothetical protein
MNASDTDQHKVCHSVPTAGPNRVRAVHKDRGGRYDRLVHVNRWGGNRANGPAPGTEE